MANTAKQMVFRGEWQACANYSVGDVTLRYGALWLAVAQNAGIDPESPEGQSFWMMVGDAGEEEKAHNELEGLQGGDKGKDEFFHVEKNHLAALRQARNPSETNPFLTAENMPALEKRVSAFQMREKPEGAGALYAAAFGDGAFVGVGDHCAVRSGNGKTWSAGTAPEGFWRGVAFGGGTFAAVGLDGHAMWSRDGGLTWDAGAAPEGDWNALAYGNGMFVGVCDGKVMKSLDGRTGWTARTAPAGHGEDIAFGNGVFVAVGQAGVMTSTDGETWTERETPTGTWRCVEYGDGKFVALAGKCVVSTDDGQSWEEMALPSGGWDAVRGGGGFFVAVGNSAHRIVTGTGELAWVQTAAPNFLWRGLAFGLDIFVAVGSGIMSAEVVDAAAALSGANGPSGGNPFATMADLAETRSAVEAFREELARISESLVIEGEA